MRFETAIPLCSGLIDGLGRALRYLWQDVFSESLLSYVNYLREMEPAIDDRLTRIGGYSKDLKH